jgi:hypothetical protein
MSIVTRLGKGAPLTFAEMDGNFTTIAGLINAGFNYSLDIGSLNALAITLTTPPASYIDGMNFSVKVANTTTSTSTLNINGLGAKNIYDEAGNLLTAGTLNAGQIYTFVYNASLNSGAGGFNAFIPNATNVPVAATTNNTGTTVAQQLINLGSATGVTNTGYTPPGTSTVATTQQEVNNRRISLFNYLSAAQKADAIAGTLLIDCSAAVQNFLNDVATTYFKGEIEPYAYRMSAGVTQFGQSSIQSFGFQPTNPPTGCRFVFDLGVTGNCWTMGGPSASDQSCSLKGISILRAAGTIPAGSIGLMVQNVYATTVEDVAIMRHSININFKMNATGTAGISCMINRIWTGGASDCHVVLDSWPEARFNQCRFGMNGAGDLAGNEYIRIQGGTSNAAGGPDSIFFENCQFNQGVNSMTNWMSFKNFLVGSSSVGGLYSFTGCYIEDNVHGIFSDSSWTTANGAFASILQFMFNNCVFNPSTNTFQFLNLNVGTQINNMTIGNSQIKCALTYAGTAQINTLTITNTQFNGLVSLTGVSNSVAVLGDNTYGNGLTLAGAWGGSLSVIGGAITGGSLTNTATGTVKVDVAPNNSLLTFTPSLKFGGGNTGITYGLQAGGYQVFGNRVTGQFILTLTAVGSSTGSATLEGLPFAPNGATYGGGGGGMINFALNMVALTAAPMMLSIAAGTQFNIYQQTATGLSAITNGNFSATSTIHGTFEYFM